MAFKKMYLFLKIQVILSSGILIEQIPFDTQDFFIIYSVIKKRRFLIIFSPIIFFKRARYDS